MGMKYCPDCGEEYSDTYKHCPFCEEAEMLRDEKSKRRMGRRAKPAISPITVILLILIAVMSVLLVYLLKDLQKPTTLPSDAPGQEEPLETPGQAENPAEPETPVGEPTDTPNGTTPENGDGKDAKLNKEDMTLSGGESARLELSGVTTKVTWTSSNETVAKVSDNGIVTAVRNGMCEIQAAWDGQVRTCIVRVVNAGSAVTTEPNTPATPATQPTQPNEPSSGLKTGAAKVSNAASGVFVRSGPGTSNEALATLKTGDDVTILESAGSGWYKISFVGIGGRTTTGYMKGDYLANK